MTELTISEALKRGIKAHKSGEIEEADRYYTAILKVQPHHPDANHNIGVLSVGLGKVEQAIPYFKIAIEANSNISQFWLSLIDAYIRLGDLGKAEHIIEEARRADIDASKELLSRAHQISKGIQSSDPSQEALGPLIEAYNNGQHLSVLKGVKELLTQYPTSVLLYNLNGAANASLKNYDVAIESYKRAIECNPNHAEAHNNLGIVYRDTGNLTAAIESYKKALALNPNYAKCYNNLGNVLRDRNEPERAIESYQKAVRVNPNYAEAYKNMGDLLQYTGRSQSAIKSYEQAIRLNHNYAEAYHNLGAELLNKKDIKGVLALIKRGQKLIPDYAGFCNLLGACYLHKGMLTKAFCEFLRALEMDAMSIDAAININNQVVQLADKELEENLFTVKLMEELQRHPGFIIQEVIKNFINNDLMKVIFFLKFFDKRKMDYFDSLKHSDKIFIGAYKDLINALIIKNKDTRKPAGIIYHIGESHCLSYAHNIICNAKKNYTVRPLITFGAKAFHFSDPGDNPYKSITEHNFRSVPANSIVFVSFGEIDCRGNEGFMAASKKENIDPKNIIKKTVLGYVTWFTTLNFTLKNKLYFFNVPAPIYDNDISPKTNVGLIISNIS